MVLDNGVAICKVEHGMINVYAMFRGSLDIVFQSFEHAVAVRYCHMNGMRAVNEKAYRNAVNASFRKANAKKPYNPDEWVVGTVF